MVGLVRSHESRFLSRLWACFLDEWCCPSGALVSRLVSQICFPLAQLLRILPDAVLWRIDSVDRSVVPDDIASARVAVHSFLLSTFLASDSSEPRLGSRLLVLGFLFRSAPGAC